VLASAALVAGCSTGAQNPGGGLPGKDPITADTGGSLIDRPITGTTGPNGETPVPVTGLTLSPDEASRLQAGHHRAALLWHTSSAFVAAVQNGAMQEFQRLGIEVVATGDANMNAGTQANQVRTALAKQPEVILSLPVDPVSAAAAYQPAVAAGTKLVFLSNTPNGYRHGQEYSSVVTDDLYEMGKQAAQALGRSLGGKGTVGMLYYNAKYYVTNQRDAAFRATLQREFPDIKIVAEQGFTDPGNTSGIAGAMLTQHRGLSGIYVSWAQPAAGVLSALRSTRNTGTQVVTLDVDDPVMVDLASGGPTRAVVVDKAYDLGVGMADAAAYALLGKQPPAFTTVGALTATRDNVAAAYQQSLHQAPPPSVQDAIK
jgi:ribose transport system substrate-binding protein